MEKIKFDFDKNEYVLIYRWILQQSVPAPTDCYLILEALRRVIPWIEKGQELTEEQFGKLERKSVEKVYVRAEQLGEYFAYLDEFFETPAAKPFVLEILKADPETVVGIPSLDEYAFKNPQGQKIQGIIMGSELDYSDGNAKKKIYGQNENGNILVEGQLDDSGSLNTPVTGKVDYGQVNIVDGESDVIGQVVSYLKSRQSKLEKTHVTGNFNVDEYWVKIKDVTEKISDELLRVKGGVEFNKGEQFAILANVAEKVEELLGEAEPIAELLEDKFDLSIGIFDKTRELIHEMKNRIQSDNFDEADFGSISLETRKIKTRIKKFLPTIDELRESIQDKLNDVELKEEFARLSELAARLANFDDVHVREVIKGQLLQGGELTSGDILDSDLIEKLKKIIIQQASQIKSLQDQNQKMSGAYDVLRSKMMIFETLGKSQLDIDGKFKLKDLHNAILSLRPLLTSQTHSLNEAGTSMVDLCAEVEIDYNAIESKVYQEVSAELDLEELDGDPGESENENLSEMERLIAENNLLKTQLENAQKLLEASDEKATEIQSLLEERDDYLDSIEENNQIYQEQITQQGEKLDQMLASEEKYQAALEKADKDIFSARVNEGDSAEKMADLKNQIDVLKTELDIYRNKLNELFGTKYTGQQLKDKLESIDPASLISLEDAALILSEKDARLKELQKYVDMARTQVNDSKKQIASLKITTDTAVADKQTLSKRIIANKLELDTVKKTNVSLERKLGTNTHLLKEARKSISKFTVLIENLKHDRQTYITKTNKAMNDFKDMTRKASSLQRHVDASDQKLADLEKKNERLRETERELRTQLNVLAGEVKNLQHQLKKSSAA